MVVYQLECAECGELRVGRETDDRIEPVREDCPNCGASEYEVLAHDSDED